MRNTTELYNEAKNAGAKPLILAFLGSSTGVRCLGKQTPSEDYARDFNQVYIGSDTVSIGTDFVFISEEQGTNNAWEWEARVIDFGDFRQTISENPDSIFEGLIEKEMESYTLVCDNADGFFTEIVGKEQLVNYPLILKQGFDYPGFQFSDFLRIFYGRNTTYEFDYTTFQITADQSLESSPQDISTTLEKTFALSNPGSGYTAAQQTYTYTELVDVFYTENSWTETFLFLRDSGGQVDTIFTLLNSGNTRWEVGIDASNYPYLRYTHDLTGTPDYTTITADFTYLAGVGFLKIVVNADTGTIIFSDGNGNTYEGSLSTAYAYDSKFGTTGTGNGQFDTPRGIALDSSGNIFAVDSGNDRVQKFNSSGVYQSQFGSYGTGNGQFDRPIGIAIDDSDNIWVVDEGNDRVQKFNSSGVYQSQFGSSGTGNLQYTSVRDIAIDSNGDLYVTDFGSGGKVEKVSSVGAYILTFDGNGSGYGPAYLAVDSNDKIFVVELLQDRVAMYDTSGNRGSTFGTSGSGSGQFQLPVGIATDINNRVFVSDWTRDDIQIFDNDGVYQEVFGTNGTGDGEFQEPDGMVIDANNNLWVSDSTNDRVQKLTGGLLLPDFSDQGSDDIAFGVSFGGDIFTVTHDSGNNDIVDARWVNRTGPTATTYENVYQNYDTTLVDGTWEEWGTVTQTTTQLVKNTEITAFQDVVLTTADAYTNASQDQRAMILPLPYGNLNENSGSGVWACPCIDTANYVYCVAGWPVLSVANGNTVIVFVDGVFTAVGYTFDENNNYEGRGAIATLTFAADQGDATITVMCHGKETSVGSGTIIENPIDIVEDWVDYAVGLTSNVTWQKDETSFSEAWVDAENAGYVGAGVIQANNPIGFWIQTMLNPFLGSYKFGSGGTLQVFLYIGFQSEIQDQIDEHEAISLKVKEDETNILNRIIVNFAVSYTQNDRRFKEGSNAYYFLTEDRSSTTTSTDDYGEHAKTFNFDWCRRIQNVRDVIDLILERYELPEFLVNYEGQDFKMVPLETGDHIEGSLSLIRNNENEVIENLPFVIREKTHNLDEFTTQMALESVGVKKLLGVNYVLIGSDYVVIGTDKVAMN